MKFILMFKTPDVLDQIDRFLGTRKAEKESATKFAEKFVRWGECLMVEFDTEKKTVTVLENKP